MPQTSPPEPGLREQNKREKLARITQAARELFRAQGFEATYWQPDEQGRWVKKA